MKVSELIKELQKYKPDEKVYLSNDIEGNAIKTIFEVAITQGGKFDENNEWVRTKDFLTIYPTDEVVSN